MAQRYKFSAPANGDPFPIPVKGRYIRYYKALTGILNPSIIIRSNIHDEVALMPGQGVHLGENVERLEIINEDGEADITGWIVIGGREVVFDDDRVTGEVSIIDGGKARSLAGVAFSSYGRAAASPGNYSHVQLWNGSTTENDIVESFWIMAGQAGDVFWGYTQDQLATLTDNAYSKKAGGAISVCAKVYQEALGAPIATEIFSHGVQAGVPLLVPIKEPIIIQPGWGFFVRHSLTNTALLASFEHFEELA